MAVGGYQLFPKEVWETAPRVVKLIGAGRAPIKGGYKGVRVSVDLPVAGRNGLMLLRCMNVFIYMADIGPRILLGFPFLLSYNLAFIPTSDYLVPLEDFKKSHIRCQLLAPAETPKSILRVPEQQYEKKSVSFSRPLILSCRSVSVSCFAGRNHPGFQGFSQGIFKSLVQNSSQAPHQVLFPSSSPSFQLRSGCSRWSQVTDGRPSDEALDSVHFRVMHHLAVATAEHRQPSAPFLVKKLHPSAYVPIRCSEGAAGYDLRTPETFTVKPRTQKLIPLYIAIAVPVGTYDQLASRSSFAVKGVHVRAGVIDQDYRGNVKVLLENATDESVVINAGDRFAQLLVLPLQQTLSGFQEVDELPDTSRGSGGFGSTNTGSSGMGPTSIVCDRHPSNEGSSGTGPSSVVSAGKLLNQGSIGTGPESVRSFSETVAQPSGCIVNSSGTWSGSSGMGSDLCFAPDLNGVMKKNKTNYTTHTDISWFVVECVVSVCRSIYIIVRVVCRYAGIFE